MSLKIWDKCIQDAKDMGVNLFPVDCIDILKDNYKRRLEYMRPQTIFTKIRDLMGVEVSDPDNNEIIEVINDYITFG